MTSTIPAQTPPGTPLVPAAAAWYRANARDLPWRRPGTTPWGVLVSEVMSQQTPVARVQPRWLEWMARWPRPADLAAATGEQVLRAWDRLGYPRRALRLREAAAVITAEHHGSVPADEADLLSLPGIGPYTAAAVAGFGHGRRSVMLDTNIRRVIARAVGGQALPAPSATRAETERARALVPADPPAAVEWNAAAMELGALVCTARSPRCQACPLVDRCAWHAAGFPADEHAARRRTQAWHGTDRQVRGRVLALLRERDSAMPAAQVARALAAAGVGAAQRDRALDSLVTDGLAEVSEAGYRLPMI